MIRSRTLGQATFVPTLLAAALLIVLGAGEASAKPDFGPLINDFCTANGRVPAQPYDPVNFPAQCQLCHLPGYFDKNPAHQVMPEAQEFLNAKNGLNGVTKGDYSFFCPPAAAPNNPPVLAPIGARQGTEGQRLSFTISATDPDGDALAFTATNLPAGASLVDNLDGTALFDWTPGPAQVGLVDVTFQVTDDGVPPAGAMETVSIVVFNANRPPVVAPIGNRSVDEGMPLAFDVTASDPDADAVAWSASGVPTGASFVDNGDGTGSFAWTPGYDKAGNYPITFTATDDGAPMASASEAIVVTVGDVNRPPVLAPIGNRSVDEGMSLAFALSASDPDGDALTLQAANLPAGASFVDHGDGTGDFAWTPGFGDMGNYAVTFTVSDDGAPSATDSEVVAISVGDVNGPPVLAPIGDRTVGEGETLSFVVTATDPDGDTLTLQAGGLPTGASFTDNGDGTGAFSWSPGFGTAGSYPVSFTATDNGSPAQSDSESLVLTVGKVNRPPVLAPIGARQLDEGQTLDLMLSASDPDGDGLTLQVSGAPAAATLVDNGDGTGSFVWTPGYADSGNHVFTFSVSDDGSPPQMDGEAVTVTVGDVNRPPVLAPIGNRMVDEGTALGFDATASDPDGDALVLSVSGLPSGASFSDGGNGTGRFDWTPGFGDMGNYTLTFTATDAGNPPLAVSETVTLTVGDVNRAPVLAPIGNRSLLEDETLAITVMASDADGDALTLMAANLPAGATFTDNGDGTAAFSWTPTTGDAGNTVVDFSVTDAGNPPLMDSEAVTISVVSPGAGLQLTRLNWSGSFGGQLIAKGVGAMPGDTVELIDADLGNLLGVTTANKKGAFDLRGCRVIKRHGRRRMRLDCTLPRHIPCAVQVRSGGLLGPRFDVPNAPAQCGAASELLLEGSAQYNPKIRVKRKGKKKKVGSQQLVIEGGHAGADASVEIRDADTDAVMVVVSADATGRFSWSSEVQPTVMPCRVRLGVNNEFGDPIEVVERQKVRRRGKVRRRMRPMCAPASAPLPAPTPTPGAGSGGAGGAGGAAGAGTSGTPGGGGSGGSGGTGTGGGAAGATASLDAFQQTVYPLTRQYCATCHVAGPGSPPIAHDDLNTAFRAVVDNQKVDLASPYTSRLVQRLATDGHFCWSGDCAADAETMRAAVARWAALVGAAGGAGGGTSDPAALATAAVTLADGEDARAARLNDPDLVALYEFLTGSGDVAYDTSGTAPAMDLALSGVSWLPGGGIQVESGKATATPATSRKLYDTIAAPGSGSQEYTIEAWITPANTDQRGPARIVTYSLDPYNRNFMMGQENYNYVFRNRSRAPGIGRNGTPALYTDDGDRRLQPTLQHVVMTYDQSRGRRIYVNGRFTGDEEPNGTGAMDVWNPEYTFVLGNEVTDNRLWKGRILSVAIYRRSLSAPEVASHFDAGVGESRALRFDVSTFTGVAGSYVEMRVAELDAGSYLFSRPVFVGPVGTALADLRIAVNGRVPVAGQAFRSVNLMTSGSPQTLSPLASVIAKDRGPDLDAFSLEFGALADHRGVVAGTDAPVVPGGWSDEPRPDVGIRDFEEIHLTMAALTGVDPTERSVERTFDSLEQQLPSDHDVRSFGASQQVGIFKLAVEYCDELVDSSTLREAFFGPEFRFYARPDDAFADPAMKQRIADRLVERFFGTGLAGQPTADQVSPIVTGLIDDLTARCSRESCDSSRTRATVKAACSAVLGSAPVVLH